eukprot:TRINITY_DN12533_c0_g1_i1.p1 TRINITY_DN12533_c0_g1~~TRINITY_DN12533_c0_g1_i1.p1  ORF type:complete len:387 (+),score=51.01 TRINITY_DN12533_c0_g1_i1:59-1219(+)
MAPGASREARASASDASSEWSRAENVFGGFWPSDPRRLFAADGFSELFADSVELAGYLCTMLGGGPSSLAISAAVSATGFGTHGGEAVLTLSATPVLLGRNQPLDPDDPDESQAARSQRITAAPANFLETLFPGYFEGSALMRISVLQVAAFGISLIISGTGAYPSACVLHAMGAGWGPAIAHGEVWRLVCPIFLHAGLQHVATNCLFQMRLGYRMERLFGSKNFAKMYIIAGGFGNLVSCAVDPWKLSVGSSTSGMAVMGCTVASALMDVNISGNQLKATLTSSAFILAAVNMSGSSDVFGHVGGFLAGLLLTPVFLPDAPISTDREGTSQRLALRASEWRGPGTALLTASSAAAVLRLLTIAHGDGPHPDCASLADIARTTLEH